jgi:hypothetical protein
MISMPSFAKDYLNSLLFLKAGKLITGMIPI